MVVARRRGLGERTRGRFIDRAEAEARARGGPEKRFGNRHNAARAFGLLNRATQSLLREVIETGFGFKFAYLNRLPAPRRKLIVQGTRFPFPGFTEMLFGQSDHLAREHNFQITLFWYRGKRFWYCKVRAIHRQLAQSTYLIEEYRRCQLGASNKIHV